MERKRLRKTAYLTIFSMVLILVLLSGATYAWFTFSPFTNVTPMSGSIGKGDASLLIANRPDGTFAKECSLILEGKPDLLYPVSTADLTRFSSSKAQNTEGISILFADATNRVDTETMHGKVYLKCENGSCRVYFYRSGLDFGTDGQALAALRLGMKMTTKNGSETYVFRLDSFGNTASAQTTRTVPEAGTVVSSLDGSGNAVFVKDPSVDLSEYQAVEKGAGDAAPGAGKNALGFLEEGEIASVEYWLYLEGCDDNCITPVQSKDINLKLAFSGVKEK